MKLSDLLAYDEIVIQCHDNPDADALASGFAVYRYLESQGKKPRLIYGGRNYIRKSNLVMLIDDLKIPVEHVDALKAPELLVMVDCQYMGGNAECFGAKHVAVLDHHRVSTKLPELSEVRSSLGACSTLVWQLLKEEGYEVGTDTLLGTALYYGLYTDTSSFTEIVHPLDRDLRDEAAFDAELMVKYRNANLSLEELEIAGAALLHSDYMDEHRCAIVKSAPCDPNILGLISDLVLAVDAVDCCIVFNMQPHGVKLSVRSCVREVKANELAEELCRDIGSGGGHLVKAGGFIPMELLVREYLNFCEHRGFVPRMELDATGQKEQPTASGVKAVLEWRAKEYLSDTDFLCAEEFSPDAYHMEAYVRRPVPWGYVRATDLFETGTHIIVRTLSGDEEFSVEPDMVLTIGPKGEVHRSRKVEFERRYRYYPDWEFRLLDAEYDPTVKAKDTGKIVSTLQFAHVCVPRGKEPVSACCLNRKVKLFGRDCEEPYLLGRLGDYLVCSPTEPQRVMIVERDLFVKTYRLAEDAGTKRRRAVIFDLDGTLMDTLEDLKEAVNKALAFYGMPLCTLEQVRGYVGNGIRKLMLRAVPDGANNPAFEEVFGFFREYYDRHCLDTSAPYRNILNLLEELHAQEVPMAIVSNKVDSAVKELNKRFFSDYISVAFGERAGIARKPAPDTVLHAISALGVSPENAVYVGDSDVDIETAANAGLACVSVTWGFRDENFLRAHGAKTLIQRPLELLYLI